MLAQAVFELCNAMASRVMLCHCLCEERAPGMSPTPGPNEVDPENITRMQTLEIGRAIRESARHRRGRGRPLSGHSDLSSITVGSATRPSPAAQKPAQQGPRLRASRGPALGMFC